MAYEFPVDLIKELQISLRKEANLSSYDPDDPSLLNLPSLNETIAEFDPSPPYLRCKNCKGRLLRGVKSLICVFCGREQNTEVPPDPINFKNTIACRWLLESLDLDGSEMVGAPIDSKESNRGKLPEQFPLSGLLDLEIRWPSESEKQGMRLKNETPVSSNNTMNLGGVDLDDYFSNEKESTSILSAEPLPLNKQIDGSERTLQDNVDVSLFGDGQPSGTATRTSKHESDDSFSGWEASFQSASSANLHDKSKSIDPFPDSVVNFSSPPTFRPQKKSGSGEVEDYETRSPSMANDWFQQQDESWSNSNHETSGVLKQVEQPGNFMDGRTTVANAEYSSSVSGDWFQDDQWQRGNKKKSDDKSVNKDHDSDDDWDDFTTSTSVQVPSDNSKKATVNEVVQNVDGISEIDFFSSTISKDSNSRNFYPPNLFAETFSYQNGSAEGKITQSEASDLNRTAEENGKSEKTSGGTESVSISGSSSNSDAHILLGKMHDLSFMLESHLSIPPK